MLSPCFVAALSRPTPIWMDDLERSFASVFPRDKKTRSYASKTQKLFAHLLPSVSCTNLNSFLQYFHDKVRSKYTEIATVSAIFTQMRKTAQQKRPECLQQCRATIKLSDRERKEAKHKNDKRIEHANKHVHTFSEEVIEQAVQQWKESGDPADKIPLLMIQSGMRLIEVLRLASISPGTQSNYIRMSNLAKSKSMKNKRVDKPLLFCDS